MAFVPTDRLPKEFPTHLIKSFRIWDWFTPWEELGIETQAVRKKTVITCFGKLEERSRNIVSKAADPIYTVHHMLVLFKAVFIHNGILSVFEMKF